MLYGVSKALTEYIKQGEAYSTIKKIISINLVYFDLGQGEDYVYLGKTEFIGLNKKDVLKLDNVQQELYKTEKISDIYPEYYILKINRFDDIARNTIDEWIYFFKNEKIEDNFTARGLKEAKQELDIMKLSDEERKEYEAYQEELRYEASMFESSYKVGEMKGEKRGMEKGAKEKALQIARESLKEKLTIELIMKLTGLSKEEIEKI